MLKVGAVTVLVIVLYLHKSGVRLDMGYLQRELAHRGATPTSAHSLTDLHHAHNLVGPLQLKSVR